MRVDRLCFDGEAVLRSLADDLVVEDAPQLGHVRLDQVACARRRLVTPQRIDQAVVSDDAVGIPEQQRKDEALFRTAQPDARAVRRGGHWAQHSVPHPGDATTGADQGEDPT